LVERKFKVMRVEKMFRVPLALVPTELEAEELAKVNAGLVDVECATEDEIIEAAKDADALLVGVHFDDPSGYGDITKIEGSRLLQYRL